MIYFSHSPTRTRLVDQVVVAVVVAVAAAVAVAGAVVAVAVLVVVVVVKSLLASSQDPSFHSPHKPHFLQFGGSITQFKAALPRGTGKKCSTFNQQLLCAFSCEFAFTV